MHWQAGRKSHGVQNPCLAPELLPHGIHIRDHDFVHLSESSHMIANRKVKARNIVDPALNLRPARAWYMMNQFIVGNE